MTSGGILLVGPRGAGKTVVGGLLGSRLALPFLDSDRLIEAESGRTVAELLRAGEFRHWEATLLGALLARGAMVIASGGGAVLWEGLPEAARGWTVVWLDAEAGVLARRILGDPRPRPSLTGAAPEVEIGRIREERGEAYGRLATLRVETGSLTPEEVVALLLKDPRVARHSRRTNTD